MPIDPYMRVAVAFQILGIFIYPLSIPVYSSLSIEFSSKLCLFRRTPSCASNSFSTPKSTWSSYIWNICASHWDGKKATFAQTTFCKCRSISRTYWLMHCESMESPPPPLPPNKSKYLKEIMAKSLWKIHLRSAWGSFSCSPLKYLHKSVLWSDLHVSNTKQQFTLPRLIVLSKQS